MPLGFTSLGPDIGDFIRWGTLADSHLYPYIHYWSEYPPLLGWLIIALYRLSTLVPAWPEDPRFWFGLVVKMAMAAFDVGNLVLVYTIALRLGDKSRAILTAALFAGGFITAYAAWGWLDVMPLFFLLLALYLSLRDRPVASAVAAGVGALIKIVPIVVAPTVVRRIAGRRQQLTYLLVLGATLLTLLLPFLISNAPFVAAFVHGSFNRPAWGSIWAALEGHFQFGFVAPVSERFVLDSAGAVAPSQLPWPIIHLAFASLFLLLYTRRINWRDPTQSVAFAGLTVNLFLLWSKGFSGQFTVYAFPFILLLMPSWRGVLYVGLLSVVWIAEWPMALFTTPQGAEQPDPVFLLWIIVVRTAVLVALCLEYAATLFPRITTKWPRLAQAVMVAGWISLAPVSLALIDAYARTQLADNRAAPALQLIGDSDSRGDKTIVFGAAQFFRRLAPLARQTGDILLLPPAEHVPEDVRIAWLDDLVARGPFWFVAEDGGQADRESEAWLSQHACKIDTQIVGSARLSRFMGSRARPVAVNESVVFAGEIQLIDVRLGPPELHPGDGLCVELDWQVLAPPSADYTVFVHVIDSRGQLVAQNDQQPQGGFAPTGGWRTGSIIIDRHGLILPSDLPAGEYVVRVGLYRSADQSPIDVTLGGAAPGSTAIQLTTLRVSP